MRRLFFAVLVAAGCSHQEPAKPAAPVANAAPPEAPAAPVETGLDESAIDQSVNPCDDFYQYSCGNWLKKTEIPADKAQWGRGFSVIDEHNEDELHTILDAASKGQVQTPYADKIGALYASCMDEAAIESSTPIELRQQLKRVDILRDLPSLQKEVARIHMSIGNPMFEFSQQQDFKEATDVIGALDQGGLGMPDRDYYLSSTGKMPELRKAYQAHVEKMMTLAGEKPARGQEDGRDGHEDRDGAGAGVDVARRSPRSEQGLPPPRSGGHREDGAEVELEELPEGDGRPRDHADQRRVAGLLRGAQQDADVDADRRLEGVPALARRAQRGAGAVQGVRRRELRVLRQDAVGHGGARAALEALHARRSIG